MYALFEGVDTSGKTTQIELLKSTFPEILATKEPAGTEFGVWAREILLGGKLHSKEAEALLFLADRAEHYERVVKPNRERKLVISDRGFISGIAYALANGSGDFEKLFELNRFALGGEMPDLVLFFEIDEATLKARLGAKAQDAIEKRGLEYILRVQSEIKSAVQRLNIPHKILDATKSIDEINREICEILSLKERS